MLKMGKHAWMIALLLLMAMIPAAVMAQGKTLTVGANGDHLDIQSAIDDIAGQADPTGWTINVKAGEYDRFTVPHWAKSDIEKLSIVGESEQSVIIHVLNEAYSESDLVDNGGINIYGKDVTLKNMTIKAGKTKQAWDDAAVSTNHGMYGGQGVTLTVDNCTLIGPGIDKGALYGIFWACSEMNVIDCTISGFANAIEFMNDGFNVPAGKTYKMTGNTITGSSFAIHGYMGGGNGGGTLLIADNTITGTDALRSKIIVQDNVAKSLVADIRNNQLSNALIGTVNLQDKGDIVSDVLKSNVFGDNCFYVEAIEPGTIQFYSTYYAPSGQYGQWRLTGIDDFDVDWGKNPDGSTAFIQKAVDEANANKSHKLSITGIDEDNLIKTFTWFKDGIYWETLPEPTPAPTATPVPDTSDLPQTGDNSNLALFALLLTMSAAGMLLLMRKRNAQE